jgi:hypothetical protein
MALLRSSVMVHSGPVRAQPFVGSSCLSDLCDNIKVMPQKVTQNASWNTVRVHVAWSSGVKREKMTRTNQEWLTDFFHRTNCWWRGPWTGSIGKAGCLSQFHNESKDDGANFRGRTATVICLHFCHLRSDTDESNSLSFSFCFRRKPDQDKSNIGATNLTIKIFVPFSICPDKLFQMLRLFVI